MPRPHGTKPKGYIQPGTAWIEDAMDQVGIASRGAPVPGLPEAFVRYEVERDAIGLPLSEDHWIQGKPKHQPYGDVFWVHVECNNFMLDGLTLTPRRSLSQANPPAEGACFREVFDVTGLQQPDVAAIFTPVVRALLVGVPLCHIVKGRCRFPTVHAMFTAAYAAEGAALIESDWRRVRAFLDHLQFPEPVLVRLFLMAALDPDPWFRRQAATLFFKQLRGIEWVDRLRPDWPAAFRRGTLQRLADLPSGYQERKPADLFEAVAPLLHHPKAQPELFDPGGSAVAGRDFLNRPLQAEDLSLEAWLVAAILFPEQVRADFFAAWLPALDDGTAFLWEDLLHWLPPHTVDALLPGLLENASVRPQVFRLYLDGHESRLDHLARIYFETQDRELQNSILQHFRVSEDPRLPDLLRRALPLMLEAGYDDAAGQTGLIEMFLGLSMVGELGDLALIERARAHCSSEAAIQAYEHCRRAILAREGTAHDGSLSLVTREADQGALSLPETHAGELSRLSQPGSASPDRELDA
ncbi:hypothetical protein [Acanthopleuribacter pedis]|uniref:Uncharacterized protein n=1 Tax=Acanthopleuribacter pedis TaxID=442870 RepID=A0A8J7QFG6_9BACT|nr:hypothetical protein [Acanthopleuribacter pedis]MBO1323119.1 hypothetical protein [Acanthopleuribacter pedis]